MPTWHYAGMDTTSPPPDDSQAGSQAHRATAASDRADALEASEPGSTRWTPCGECGVLTAGAFGFHRVTCSLRSEAAHEVLVEAAREAQAELLRESNRVAIDRELAILGQEEQRRSRERVAVRAGCVSTADCPAAFHHPGCVKIAPNVDPSSVSARAVAVTSQWDRNRVALDPAAASSGGPLIRLLEHFGVKAERVVRTDTGEVLDERPAPGRLVVEGALLYDEHGALVGMMTTPQVAVAVAERFNRG